MKIRKGDIVEFDILPGCSGFQGSGMVIDDQVVKHHIIDDDEITELIIVRDIDRDELGTFGRRFVTKVIKCREDIEKFWEYL